MFSRVTITLGIGPHSSSVLYGMVKIVTITVVEAVVVQVSAVGG